ncbi:ABC transporter substrate-binding protein [Halalkalibacter urbisdiaboli]|uniref:ABC transporter substrate-binding protein n=1 Tax=Halalkalibacter urbisdiaboli TaxID=1960589 RepID=UPI000B452614|nr:extracellular solute-binding protein [Halalkalibacter urbisdiaboli]
MNVFRLSMIVVIIFLSGCHVQEQFEYFGYNAAQLSNADSELGKDETTNTLTIWTREYDFQHLVEQYNRKFPNVTVEVVEINRHELVNKYLNSLIEQNTPDLYVILDKDLGEFSGIDGFENLMEEPYSKSYIFNRLPEPLLKQYQFFMKDGLLSIPMSAFPYVTYYRSDILENAGFPSDPELLAEFMKDTDNWLEMSTALKEKNHYLIDGVLQLLFSANRSTNYFDEQLNYTMAEDGQFQSLFEVSKFSYEHNLASHKNLWSEDGKEALRTGELAMVHLASYGEFHLQNWVPEQAGKWRVTRMPLGLEGIEKETGKSLAMSSSSQNKELAWEFIEIAAESLLYSYTTETDSSFFGTQDTNNFYWELINEGMRGQPTPLDRYAYDYWELGLYQVVMGSPINESTFSVIEDQVNERIKRDKQALLKLRND